jgi:hypothetical protein
MFQKLLCLLIFYFFISQVKGYDLVHCSKISTYYKFPANNTLSFLSTPNFPKSIYEGCNIRIIAPTNNNIWVSMLNGRAYIWFSDGSINDADAYYDSNDDTFTYTTSANTLDFTADIIGSPWAAVQAAAVSFDPTSANYTCPLSGQTFDFILNPEIVIPILPTFYQDNDASDGIIYKNCNWTFTTNSATQLLKIVVYDFSYQDQSFSLSLTVDGEIVKNFTSVSNSRVYYFNGSIANLKFLNQGSEGDFFILVSAIPEFESYTSDGCSVTTNSNGDTVFTNGDYITGYPSYQHCENTIIVQENFESALILDESNYEMCCDKLTFEINGSKWTSFDQLTLTSKANGSLLYFHSDGNTQSAGYKAILETYKCECADSNIVLDCDNNIQIFPMRNTAYFCSNITCDFKISPNSNCSNKYFYLFLNSSPYSASINLTINGNLTQIKTNRNFEGYYSQNSNITFRFSSNISEAFTAETRFWRGGSVKPFAPNFKKIQLNETHTKHLLWLQDMKNNDAITVCTNSGTLEVYVSQVTYESGTLLQNYKLFDGDNYNGNFVGTIADIKTSGNTPGSTNSSTGCFTVSFTGNNTSDYTHMILFKISDKKTLANCDIYSTVYQIFADDDSYFNFQSSSAGPCEIIFFGSVRYDPIPEIRIQSINIYSNSTVSFLSTVNNKLLLKLNNSEAPQWVDFEIYTPGLTVIIPPSSNISIYFNGYGNFIGATTVIQKGISTSPSYCGFNQNFYSRVLYQSDLNNDRNLHEVKFSFKERYGNPNVIISAYNQNITVVNDTTSILPYGFQIIYEETDFSKNGFLIEYIINNTDTYLTTNARPTATSSFPFFNVSKTTNYYPTFKTSTMNIRPTYTTSATSIPHFYENLIVFPVFFYCLKLFLNYLLLTT